MRNKYQMPSIDVIKKQVMVTINVAWKNGIDFSMIEEWLSNFTGEALGSVEDERRLAMWLLYNFVFYNEEEIKHLCRLMLKKYLHNTLEKEKNDIENINSILAKTNFIGLGKSSESGAYILYLFRQENELPLRFFNDKAEINMDENVVFIDDMTLSGNQALKNMKKFKYTDSIFKNGDVKDSFLKSLAKYKENDITAYIRDKLNCNKNNLSEITETLNNRIIKNIDFYKDIKKYVESYNFDKELEDLLKEYENIIEDTYVIMKLNRLLLENIYRYDFEKSINNIKIHNWYLLTFIASEDAIKKLENEGIKVNSCIVLDEYSKAFSDNSMAFSSYPDNKDLCKKMCQFYGERIKPKYPLGYSECQYMFGIYYNIPNNTLPIFWSNDNWKPLFIRHEKNYTGGVKDVFGRFI